MKEQVILLYGGVGCHRRHSALRTRWMGHSSIVSANPLVTFPVNAIGSLLIGFVLGVFEGLPDGVT